MTTQPRIIPWSVDPSHLRVLAAAPRMAKVLRAIAVYHDSDPDHFHDCDALEECATSHLEDLIAFAQQARAILRDALGEEE